MFVRNVIYSLMKFRRRQIPYRFSTESKTAYAYRNQWAGRTGDGRRGRSGIVQLILFRVSFDIFNLLQRRNSIAYRKTVSMLYLYVFRGV